MVDTISARYNASEHQHRTLTPDQSSTPILMRAALIACWSEVTWPVATVSFISASAARN